MAGITVQTISDCHIHQQGKGESHQHSRYQQGGGGLSWSRHLRQTLQLLPFSPLLGTQGVIAQPCHTWAELLGREDSEILDTYIYVMFVIILQPHVRHIVHEGRGWLPIIVGIATVFNFPFNTPILPFSPSTMVSYVFYYVCICFNQEFLICILM